MTSNGMPLAISATSSELEQMIGRGSFVQPPERVQQVPGGSTACSQQRREWRRQRCHRMVMMILQIVIHAQMVHRRGRLLALQQRIARGAPFTAAAVVVVGAVVERPNAATCCTTTGSTVVRHRQAVQIRIGEFS